MPACFRMFRCGPTSEGALCMFGQNGLEGFGMFGMFWHVLPCFGMFCHVLACFAMFCFGPTREEALCMFEQNRLEAMLACFGMFRFCPTWDEALCIFEQNGLEAMWHVSLREEALCMFEQNGLEAILACFGAFCFGMCWKRYCHVYVLEAMLAFFFALAQHGKRPCCFGPTWEEAQRGKRLCACVIKMFWKR